MCIYFGDGLKLCISYTSQHFGRNNFGNSWANVMIQMGIYKFSNKTDETKNVCLKSLHHPILLPIHSNMKKPVKESNFAGDIFVCKLYGMNWKQTFGPTKFRTSNNSHMEREKFSLFFPMFDFAFNSLDLIVLIPCL